MDLIPGDVFRVQAEIAEQVADLLERRPLVDYNHPIVYFAVLGDTVQALDWVERAAEARFAPLPTTLRTPLIRSFYGHPRLQAVLDEMGLGSG